MSRFSFLLICLLVALSTTGCKAKKTLDKNVDQLLDAVKTNNYMRFTSVIHKALVAEFPKQKFHRLHVALKSLGAFKKRSMIGINIRLGAPSQGTYNLAYEKGYVRLLIAVRHGQIVKFNFTGKALTNAWYNAKYSKLSIQAFRFVSASGKTTNNIRPPGKVRFRFNFVGVKMRERNANISVHLIVKNKNFPAPKRLSLITKKAIHIPPKLPPVTNINGSVTLPRPGAYKIEFYATDHIANKTIKMAQAVVIMRLAGLMPPN